VVREVRSSLNSRINVLVCRKSAEICGFVCADRDTNLHRNRETLVHFKKVAKMFNFDHKSPSTWIGNGYPHNQNSHPEPTKPTLTLPRCTIYGTEDPARYNTKGLYPYNIDTEGTWQDDHSDHKKDTLNGEAQEHTLHTDSKTKLDKTSHSLSRLTCEWRQEQWLLCQDVCGCKNSMPNLGCKTRIIQD